MREEASFEIPIQLNWILRFAQNDHACHSERSEESLRERFYYP
jgi:hypothetical protein